ncbi:MAG: CocE/NonD family hydrolase [Anaerolineae bacterium]|nr:CocE/NonD family hydrolase [Anaerolineae bacterium]
MSYTSLIVERDVEMMTRDGVVLRADIYRPNTPEPVPVLLERTPYGKGLMPPYLLFALMAAERGYAVVIQDTRGRWASEGDGAPFVHEMQDGYDAVEWAAHQPWANGQVGMFGVSYMGYTQLAAAVMRPPSLKTIIPAETFCDAFGTALQGGAPTLGVTVSWGLIAQALHGIVRLPDTPEKGALFAAWVAAWDGMVRGDTFERLPLKDMPLIGRGGVADYVGTVLAHPTHDAYWEALRCPHESLDLPIFHIGGWYDIFIANTLSDYAGIRAAGNAQQKLIIGPWAHGNYESVVGEVDFGIQSDGMAILPEEMHLRWFDYWLKGTPNGVMDEPPVRLFVMGDNQWRSEQEWPLARAQNTRYYLHSGGRANTLNGDGALSPEAPSDEAVDSFVYDPRNPVPTRGGALCCGEAALPSGAYDQRAIEARPDVLVYSTPPLERDLEVTGPLEVHLWAATTAPDTDFTAKLVDVGPCGYARNLTDGIVRARHHRSLDRAEFITPGEVYEYVIDLAATCNVFKAGHRIRVEISSSNFPRFDRNANSGLPLGEDTALRPALQTIWHDAAHPSHIILPVIPR